MLGEVRGRITMVEQDKISPCLWFDNQAEEAANFYVSVFREARILNISRISAGPAEGNALVELELFGHKFTAFDGWVRCSSSPPPYPLSSNVNRKKR